MRYVDDTLLFAKVKDIKLIHEYLNSFSKNIKFAIGNFPDSNAHFLEIHIDKNHTNQHIQDSAHIFIAKHHGP